MERDLISVVVPCHNEQEVLPLFYTETVRQLSAIDGADFELIFVDDGSKDDTLLVMRALAAEDARVRYLSLSRNFGKESAMLAGFEAAKGDYIAVMDADLQDPPALLRQMYTTLKDPEQDYDCVGSRRVTRKGEPPIRSFFATLFYKIINRLSETEIVDGARDFRLMNRRMLDAVLALPERNRFSKGLFSWVGFKTKWLEYENIERAAGTTKWSFWKLLLYSLEGIVAFSTAPLAIASLLGLLFCVISFVMILVIIVKTLVWGDPVAGWPSTICVVLMLSGIQLFTVGIVGQYLAKAYTEVKARPVYLVRETEQDLAARGHKAAL